MKRRPPIAKTLVKNSKAAIFAGIEIHNKPVFSYRYEVVVLLFINAWELLLKAYIYKYQKKVRLFDKNGYSKPFLECLNCVTSNRDKTYKVIEENLVQLYNYRNEIAHFHIKELDVIIFSLLCKNVLLYKKCILELFDTDISAESDLILLPIGFKKPFSPLDFLSNESFINKSSEYVKKFIGGVLKSTAKLSENGIQESILVEFNMTVINEKRTKNADIIAGINNNKNTGINIIIENIIKKPILSDDVKATPVSSISFTRPPTTDEEEIASWIALRVKDPNFIPSKEEAWRIYSIRKELSIQTNHMLELVRISILRNIPTFYWLKSLKQDEIEQQLIETLITDKSFEININILHMSAFLGNIPFNKVLSKFSRPMQKRLNYSSKKYPANGPRIWFSPDLVEAERQLLSKETEKKFEEKIEEQLTLIAKNNAETTRKIKTREILLSKSFDCYLYALNNYYK